MRLSCRWAAPGTQANSRCRARRSGWAEHGATLVEFALIAPLFFGLVFATMAGAMYVFEVQVANQAAQAGARWAVAAANFPQPVDVTNPPGCPGVEAPVPLNSGILAAAEAAAGPFASSMTVEYASASNGGSPGCQVFVEIPYVGLGGLLGFLPTVVKATGIDYVT